MLIMITVLILAIIYLSFISLGIPDAILGVAIPAITLEWSVPLSSFGIISVLVTAGTIISSFTSVYVIERLGTGRVVFLSSLMTGTSLLAFSFAPSFTWLLPLAFPLGLGAGAVDTALNNYVALHFKAHHMNWLHSFWGVGASAGPLIMGAMIMSRTWHEGYRVIGLVQLSFSLILFASLPLWKRHASHAEHVRNSGAKVADPFRAGDLPGIFSALAVMLLYTGTEVGVGLWGSTYLTLEKGYPVATAAFWMSMYYGGITVGRFFSGFISFHLSNTAMIRWGMLLSIFSGTLLLLPISETVTGVILVMMGFGFAPIFPSMLHETPVRFTPQHSQRIIGIQMGFAFLGAAVIPPLIGVVIDYVSPASFPLFITGSIILQLFFTLHLDRTVRRTRT